MENHSAKLAQSADLDGSSTKKAAADVLKELVANLMIRFDQSRHEALAIYDGLEKLGEDQ